MKKVYVATSFQNIPEARLVMRQIRDAGHEITWDWTFESVDPLWPADQQHIYLQQCGAKDFEGVEQADAVVLINHPAARDAMAEFGIAIAHRKPTYVLYPGRRTSVFFHRAHCVGTVEELLKDLDRAPLTQ